MPIPEIKAATVRAAAKDLRDHVQTTPNERQIMRELIALEDSSLVILYDALKHSGMIAK